MNFRYCFVKSFKNAKKKSIAYLVSIGHVIIFLNAFCNPLHIFEFCFHGNS